MVATVCTAGEVSIIGRDHVVTKPQSCQLYYEASLLKRSYPLFFLVELGGCSHAVERAAIRLLSILSKMTSIRSPQAFPL